jgi:phosphoenolpyruvate phosphomutase
MKKTVYVAMSADFVHVGHLQLLQKAALLGDVIVGVLSDNAIASYKNAPLVGLQARKEVFANLKNVSKVVVQETMSYKQNILTLKPDYVVHGDDWREGIQKAIRSEVIEVLKQTKGELVEYPYYHAPDIQKLKIYENSKETLPELRRAKLSELIRTKEIVRIMEAHNGLTGLIVENAKAERNGKVETFDGMWISSLCDSTAKGKPDIELVDSTSRMTTINDIMDVTTKPIILDGDTGGLTEHFVFNVRTLERMGVSAIIIEDKIGLKKNSLFGTEVSQQQDTIENFSAKIRAGKAALRSREFMIIARIESLILNQGLEDALARAKAYIQAGASGIMIHSRKKDPQEIFDFCNKYKEFANGVALIVVPTTFNIVREEEFAKHGVNVVIYANQLIRSAFPAMMNTAESILSNGRCKEVDDQLMSIKDILTLIPGGQ